MIKAIVFDLDDTLMDTTGLLITPVLQKVVKTMIENGLHCTDENEILTTFHRYKKELHVTRMAFQRVISQYGCEGSQEALFEITKTAYYESDPSFVANIQLFPDVEKTLKELKKDYLLVLITAGNTEAQWRKIDTLGIKKYFDLIMIDDVIYKLSKRECLLAVKAKFNLNSTDILVVGDNIDAEIKIGNQLGMKTIQMLHGARKDYVPQDISEEPLFQISHISDIIKIVQQLTHRSVPKIVVIGGGTGAPSMLKGLKMYTTNLAAIIGVTDSGRSTGILRKEFDIPAIGDMRNNLVALSDAEKLLSDLFQYRFDQGSLEGHSLGNLLITALIKITGSTEQAFQEVGKILKIRGKVMPCADANIHINAELEDGTILHTEDGIIDRFTKDVHLRSSIKRVFLDTDQTITALPQAIDTLAEADIIVIGPGSIYTSVITNLLVPGIPEAIRASKAKKVYVCNIMTQPSQSYKRCVSDYIKTVEQYLGKNVLDHIIVNTKKPGADLLARYEKEHSQFVEIDHDHLGPRVNKIVTADIMENVDTIEVLWNKKNLLRHDAHKIGKLLMEL